MAIDFRPDPEGFVRKVGLNTRDQNLARAVHFTPEEDAQREAQEAELAGSSRAELEEALSTAKTPAIRALL